MRRAFFILLLALAVFPVLAQDSVKVMISPYMNFQYFRNSGDSSYLKATLTYVANRVEKPLADQKLTFYTINGEKLKEAVTDSKGIVVCDLERDRLRTGDDGMWQFTASFDGNDTIEAVSSELMIKDAVILMECTEIDSLRTVSVHVEKSEDGIMVPASGEILAVYVNRMFKPLPVGEVTLDENGNGSVDFPDDLPGDLDGNLVILSKFEDHMEFGNLERREIKSWGIPYIATDHTSRRALWTKTAPKWMIYTLTILLTGVWGHYLFALISLVRIKIDSGRNKIVEKKQENIFIK